MIEWYRNLQLHNDIQCFLNSTNEALKKRKRVKVFPEQLEEWLAQKRADEANYQPPTLVRRLRMGAEASLYVGVGLALAGVAFANNNPEIAPWLFGGGLLAVGIRAGLMILADEIDFRHKKKYYS